MLRTGSPVALALGGLSSERGRLALMLLRFHDTGAGRARAAASTPDTRPRAVASRAHTAQSGERSDQPPCGVTSRAWP